MIHNIINNPISFVSFQSFTFLVNSHPVPKNDLISGDDFLSILIREDRNEDLYRDIPTRISRYRRPYVKESTSNNKEQPLPLETLFSPYQDRRKTQYYEEKEEKENDNVELFESKILSKQNNDLKEISSTENVMNVATTDAVVSTSSKMEDDTEATEMSSMSVETTTSSMKVITSVQVSSSMEEEVKIHTKRPKAKQLKSDDSMKSDSSHFHTIISAPEIVDDESEFLYSSIPRSRMQRKQDNTSPYQTIIHHDDQGTISFSSLNISPKDSDSPKQRGGSWWWYGWNYPHLSSSTTTTETDTSDDETTSIIVTTTTESTTTPSTTMPANTPTTSPPSQEESSTIIIPTSASHTTTTSTERIILHDLNKIPYDKLNAPVEDSQNNDLHALLGKFVPSNCKQQQQQQQQTTSADIKSTDTHFVSLDDDNAEQNDDNENINESSSTNTENEFHKEFTEQKTDDVGVGSAAHSYRSTEEEDDAKFGYVVEGRNYRKYRVEEKTSDGYLVGEYGVLSHNDGSLRGVRYTADSNINPRLIHDALMKFLSL